MGGVGTLVPDAYLSWYKRQLVMGSDSDQTGNMADVALLRRQELGTFLRSRRERISPQQVGLISGGRRRTPGLRREELAQMAGVGVTWYTWLEQGRDINVSGQVLEAVCRALLLDPSERAHVMNLAGVDDHGGGDGVVRECATL